MLLFVIKTVKAEIESYTFGKPVDASCEGTKHFITAFHEHSALVHEASGLWYADRLSISLCITVCLLYTSDAADE